MSIPGCGAEQLQWLVHTVHVVVSGMTGYTILISVHTCKCKCMHEGLDSCLYSGAVAPKLSCTT